MGISKKKKKHYWALFLFLLAQQSMEIFAQAHIDVFSHRPTGMNFNLSNVDSVCALAMAFSHHLLYMPLGQSLRL